MRSEFGDTLVHKWDRIWLDGLVTFDRRLHFERGVVVLQAPYTITG